MRPIRESCARSRCSTRSRGHNTSPAREGSSVGSTTKRGERVSDADAVTSVERGAGARVLAPSATIPGRPVTVSRTPVAVTTPEPSLSPPSARGRSMDTRYRPGSARSPRVVRRLLDELRATLDANRDEKFFPGAVRPRARPGADNLEVAVRVTNGHRESLANSVSAVFGLRGLWVGVSGDVRYGHRDVVRDRRGDTRGRRRRRTPADGVEEPAPPPPPPAPPPPPRLLLLRRLRFLLLRLHFPPPPRIPPLPMESISPMLDESLSMLPLARPWDFSSRPRLRSRRPRRPRRRRARPSPAEARAAANPPRAVTPKRLPRRSRICPSFPSGRLPPRCAAMMVAPCATRKLTSAGFS